jgi:hypothetical protein
VAFQDDLPSLIVDLDKILARKNELVSSLSPDDRESIFRVLERVRHYLASGSESSLSNSVKQATAREIAQLVITRLDSKMTDWSGLLHQQQQQQQQAIASGLERLVNLYYESLQEKLSPLLASLEQIAIAPQLSQQSQFEQLQQQSEHLLMSFDSNLRTVFETLDKDLQGYYDSLSQGLERMHDLGQQGEAKFIAYFQRLTQQIEPFASKETKLAQVMDDLNEVIISPPEEAVEEIRTISALTDLIESGVGERERQGGEVNSKLLPSQSPYSGWYMGIDFGTEKLSAILFDRQQEQQYAIAWTSDGESLLDLPTEVYYQADNAFFVGVAAKAKAQEKTGILFDNLKSSLNQTKFDELKTENTSDSIFQQNQIQKAIEALFSTLIPQPSNSVAAVGLSQEGFRRVLSQLEGVVLSYPAGWGESYQMRLREALINSKLVREASQIYFLEESIAALLYQLIFHSLSTVTTLVIHAGATSTELALVDVTEDYQNLRHSDFSLESFAYGGNAIDQDILVQLLYPQWLPRLNPSIPKLDENPPQPGEVEPQKRENLRSLLKSHPIGRSFLEAAKLTKMILQQQEEFRAKLGAHPWEVKRQALDRKVIEPYLKKIEPAIDSLLAKTGKSRQAIGQVICSGGTTATIWHSLCCWLPEKLPNAAIVHNTEEEIEAHIAMGLSCLALFPNLLPSKDKL